MTTVNPAKSILAGLSALSLLALTACSSAPDAPADSEVAEPSAQPAAAEEQPVDATSEQSATIYDFSAVADLSSTDELRIEIPQQLADASETYSEGRILNGITVQAASHEDSACALEIDFDYVDGIHETIKTIDWIDMNTVDHETLDLESRYVGSNQDGFTGTSTIITTEDSRERSVEIDAFSDDFETAIVPIACAPSPIEGDFVTVGFRDLSGSRDYSPIGTLAEVNLNVMASGDIHVVSSEVPRYHYSGDEHGWLSNSQTVDSQGNVIDS